MAARTRRTLQHVALSIAMAAALAGCATRYDSSGNRIYVWQFGQDTDRLIDYSNPRLPILPRPNPNFELWPIPSPYQFNDLSRYSLVEPVQPPDLTIARVGDNAGRAASFDSTAPHATVAARPGAAGDDSRTSSER